MQKPGEPNANAKAPATPAQPPVQPQPPQEPAQQPPPAAPAPKAKAKKKPKPKAAAKAQPKKTAAKPAKAKAKAATKPEAKPRTKPAASGFLGQVVGNRTSSKKAKLIAYLHDHRGERINRDSLIKLLYGKVTPASMANFNTGMGGLIKTLRSKRLPWEIKRERTDKGAVIALVAKK